MEEKLYRVYVTDSLKIIGGINIRYIDMLNGGHEEKRSAKEIINGLKNKLDEIGGDDNGESGI